MEDPTTAAAKTVLSSEENKEDFEDSLEDFGEDGEFSYLGPLGKTSELNNANNGSSSNNKTTAASIGIGVTIGVVIAIAFIGFLVYRTKKTNDTNNNNNRSNMKRSSLADQEEEEDDEFENEHYPSTSFQQHYRKGSAVVDNLTAESLTNVELDHDGDNHDGHYHQQQQHHVDVDFDVDEYSLDHSSLGTSMTSDIPLKRSHRSKQQKSYRSGSAYSSWSNRWGGGGRGSNRSVSPNRNSNNSKGNHRRNPSQDSIDLESQGDASSTAFSYTEVGASTSFGEGSAPSIASKGKFSGGMHNKNHRRNDSGLSQDSYEGDEQHHGGAYRINFDLLMEDLKEEEKELEDDHSFSNNNHNNDTTINKISRYSERDAEDNGVECTLMPSPTSVSKFRRVYSSAQQNQQQNSSTTLSISPSHSSLHSENNNISTIPTMSTTPTRNSRRSLHNNNSNHNSSNMTNSSNMLLSTSQYTIVTSPSEGEIPFDEITNKKAAQPQDHNMDNHNNNNSPSSANSTKKKKRITPPVPSEKLLTMPLPRVSSMKSNGTDNDSLGGDDIVQDLSDFLRERRRAKQNARSRSILDESAHLNENE